MSLKDLPLADLFYRLREAGLPLGVDNYQLLLRALQSGFGQPERADLARLCRALWVKSKDEEKLFNFHFDQVISQAHQNAPAATTTPAPAPQEPRAPTPVPNVTQAATPASTVELVYQTEGEAQAAQVVLQARRSETLDDREGRLIRTLEYFPVTRRQMKQTWRYLRYRVREGPPTELDVEATVSKLARDGIFLEPVMVPRRLNRAELVLLLDQDGSMVPFHALSRRLGETALRGGRFGKTSIYYFHNCPVEHLYLDPTHVNGVPLVDVLSGLRADRASVLVFSDAGAARGGYNSERVQMTKTFLQRLKQSVRRAAWLNPLPAQRWSGTTAAEIARLIPMYGVSRHGMDQAIGVLRGRRADARGRSG